MAGGVIVEHCASIISSLEQQDIETVSSQLELVHQWMASKEAIDVPSFEVICDMLTTLAQSQMVVASEHCCPTVLNCVSALTTLDSNDHRPALNTLLSSIKSSTHLPVASSPLNYSNTLSQNAIQTFVHSLMSVLSRVTFLAQKGHHSAAANLVRATSRHCSLIVRFKQAQPLVEQIIRSAVELQKYCVEPGGACLLSAEFLTAINSIIASSAELSIETVASMYDLHLPSFEDHLFFVVKAASRREGTKEACLEVLQSSPLAHVCKLTPHLVMLVMDFFRALLVQSCGSHVIQRLFSVFTNQFLISPDCIQSKSVILSYYSPHLRPLVEQLMTGDEVSIERVVDVCMFVDNYCSNIFTRKVEVWLTLVQFLDWKEEADKLFLTCSSYTEEQQTFLKRFLDHYEWNTILSGHSSRPG